jgi:hypothetical protein
VLHVLENNELWAIRVEPARHVTQTVDDTLFAYTLTLTLLSIRITIQGHVAFFLITKAAHTTQKTQKHLDLVQQRNTDIRADGC